MGAAPSWDEPGAGNWIDARKAFYVIGSTVKSGMGADEAVPFSNDAAARAFAAKNGGRVAGFADIPKDYVLGTDAHEQHSNLDAESHGKGRAHG
jgi:copper chaperone NosL